MKYISNTGKDKTRGRHFYDWRLGICFSGKGYWQCLYRLDGLVMLSKEYIGVDTQPNLLPEMGTYYIIHRG